MNSPLQRTEARDFLTLVFSLTNQWSLFFEISPHFAELFAKNDSLFGFKKPGKCIKIREYLRGISAKIKKISCCYGPFEQIGNGTGTYGTVGTGTTLLTIQRITLFNQFLKKFG